MAVVIGSRCATNLSSVASSWEVHVIITPEREIGLLAHQLESRVGCISLGPTSAWPFLQFDGPWPTTLINAKSEWQQGFFYGKDYDDPRVGPSPRTVGPLLLQFV